MSCLGSWQTCHIDIPIFTSLAPYKDISWFPFAIWNISVISHTPWRKQRGYIGSVYRYYVGHGLPALFRSRLRKLQTHGDSRQTYTTHLISFCTQPTKQSICNRKFLRVTHRRAILSELIDFIVNPSENEAPICLAAFWSNQCVIRQAEAA